MALTGNKVYNVFINSTNRSPLENSYDFNLFFDNNEIVIGENEGINVNVVSFSMLNSMYNVNQYSSNNTFILISSLGPLPPPGVCRIAARGPRPARSRSVTRTPNV